MTETKDPSSRRRSRAFVTKNACTECRKRKARCDGNRPCARCTLLPGVLCHYAVSVQVSKESMRADIEDLQNHSQITDSILNALASGNQSDFILKQLSSGVLLNEISKSLETASPQSGLGRIGHKNCEPSGSPGAESWSHSPLGIAGLLQDSSPGLHLDGRAMSTDDNDEQFLPEDGHWTSLTSDNEMMEHLLSLYFCWEYPIFASLSKRQFLEDFRARRLRYCSPLLVNAILALGCRFSDRYPTTSDPNNTEPADLQFLSEAQRLWQLEQHNPSLTTIQAAALLSIREASCGGDSKSWYYSGQGIRMAVEMGLHAQIHEADMSDDEYEVRCITFWGAFALDEAWALCTGRVPYLSISGMRVSKPAIIDIEEESEWTPYKDDGEQSTLQQRSHVRSVYRSFCGLSEVVHNSLYKLYAPGRVLKSQDMLDIYASYLNWYDSIPIALRTGANSTPAVLFIHMYYHFAILLLFAPFMKYRFINSRISPGEICTQAADAITSLVGSYRQLYGLRRTPCFVPYIVLASSIMRLAIADSDPSISPISPSMHVFQGTADLLEMIPSHEFARRGTQVLRLMAQNSSSLDPNDAQEKERISSQEEREQAIQEQLSIAETNFFSPDMQGILLKRCATTDNSIFSPFPSQDLLLFGNEPRLRRDGFELIQPK